MTLEKEELAWLDVIGPTWIKANYLRTQDRPQRTISHLLSTDVDYLVQQEIVIRARTAKQKLIHPVFKVPKDERGSRLIIDCRSLNERLPNPPKMDIPSIHAVFDGLLSSNG